MLYIFIFMTLYMAIFTLVWWEVFFETFTNGRKVSKKTYVLLSDLISKILYRSRNLITSNVQINHKFELIYLLKNKMIIKFNVICNSR